MTTHIRSKERVAKHGEVFTPEHIVHSMHNLIDNWGDPAMIYLEPTCGHGNFVEAAVQKKITEVKDGIDKITPEQARLIHAIMFPHKPAIWGTEEIQDSIESIEWHGVTFAMFPVPKLDMVDGSRVYKAKQELKEVTAQFLSIVAQGILAKHLNNG